MIRKKFMTFGVSLALTVSLLAGCTGGNQKTTSEDTTKIVQVTKVDGTTITADVGELSSGKMDMPEGTPPSGMPSGDQNGGTPPDGMPSGESRGNKPDGGTPPDGMPSEDQKGDKPDGGTPPDGMPPEGEGGGKPDESTASEKVEDEKSDSTDGNVSPDDLKEHGDRKKQNGEPPSGKPGGSSFTANGESITFTIADSTQITQEFQQGSEEASLEDIVKNSVLEITFDSENQPVKVVIKNLQAGNGFGGSDEVTNGTSANTITEEKTIEEESYTSEGDDENALRVDGTNVTLKNITVKKSKGSSSNTENGDFYGQNAGLLVLNGATATIEGGTFESSAVNGNAVFSYGEGTTVNISNAKIRTTENNSGGIQTTGGATMNASNLDIQTEGNSSAAIRSDRGGGTVKVTKGKYVTNGTGSPAIYCTADISVEEADLLGNSSEGVVVEGKNSVSLKNCNVTGNMNHTYNGDTDENIHCIMIYQSMSGDAAVGEANFGAEGGSITSKAGDLFYITNTDCNISLKDVKLALANDIFMRVEGNSSSRGWGTEGSNGGDVILTADSQQMEGNILVDSISTLKISMSNKTNYKGSINPDGTGGEVEVTLDSDSTWTLTGDSYITAFHGDTSNIDTNGYHLYVNDEEIK